MQKHVNLVDLVKSFPTNIYLQNLASIQKRTSPVKFAHLAEKSGKGSISNLSTKVPPLWEPRAYEPPPPALLRSGFAWLEHRHMMETVREYVPTVSDYVFLNFFLNPH